jgi:hypothetical protein
MCWGMRESVERAQGYSVQPVNLLVSLHKPATPQDWKYKYDIIYAYPSFSLVLLIILLWIFH